MSAHRCAELTREHLHESIETGQVKPSEFVSYLMSYQFKDDLRFESVEKNDK